MCSCIDGLTKFKGLVFDLVLKESRLEQECRAALGGFGPDLEAVRPTLKVPASRQDCVDAIEMVLKAVEQAVEKQQQRYIKPMREYVDLAAYLWRVNVELGTGDDFDYRYSMLLEMDHRNEYLTKLVEGQSEELRNWLLLTDNKFTKHLEKRNVVKPTVNATSKGYNLPPEIAGKIYSFLDLESAVTLRNTCSFWYNTFQSYETGLKEKLLQRYPWANPDGPNDTWGDCVLKFVARLKSKEWESVQKLDEMKVYKHKSSHIVAAQELKRGDTFPHGFEGIMPHEPDCLGLCDSLNCDSATNDTTLPPEYSIPESETLFRLKRYRDSFVGFSDDMIFVFPKNGVPFNYEIHMGHVKVSHIHSRYNDDREFEFYNPLTQDFIPYGSRTTASVPIAFYDGAIWWLVESETIVKTIIDLDNPGRIRYRKSQGTIRVPENDGAQFVQCEATPHFLVRKLEGGIDLVDMRTGTYTHVVYPADGHVILGYKGDHFQAWWVSPSRDRL